MKRWAEVALQALKVAGLVVLGLLFYPLLRKLLTRDQDVQIEHRGTTFEPGGQNIEGRPLTDAEIDHDLDALRNPGR